MQSKSAPVPDQELPLSLRRFLYVSAALTGGAIMVIEILGAKMLAPYVGTSHFVWTAQIAVTLVALAVGYYCGGWLVDQTSKLSRIYLCVAAAAAYLGLTVLMVRPVAYAFLSLQLALGSLLASAVLFFVPLALLAMVGPFFVRVLTHSVADVGGNIGRLTAVSTLGSFLGTILIGYVLIPFLPNSMTMALTALLLVIVAAAYYVGWDRRAATRPVTALTVAAALILIGIDFVKPRIQYAEARELYHANSNFGTVEVMENEAGDRRFYLNDFLIQDIYDPQTKKSLALFTYALKDLASAYTPKINQALCIGLGVGIVPIQLARAGAQVDVVEINPAVVPIAVHYFDCETNLLHLTIGDGRYFINQSRKHYDTVIIDAFLGDSSPSHLMTREAFQSIKRILQPDGTLVMNTFGEFQPGKDFFMASLEKTLRSVFPSVRIHASGNGNVFFVAAPRAQLQMLRQPEFDDVHFSCKPQVMEAINGIVHADLNDGMILTDDYNPVDFFDAAVREEHRRILAMHMKTL